MKEITHYITTLIIARITGTITPRENALLDRLTEEFPEVKELTEFLKQHPPSPLVQDPAILEQEALEIIRKSRAAAKPKRMKSLKMVTMAAAACIFILIVLIVKPLVLQPSQKQPVTTITVAYSKDITLIKGSDTLTLTGKKLTADAGKGLLIDDSMPITRLKHGDPDEEAILMIPAARTYLLALSDGTQIKLNAGTKIRFPTLFRAGEREIQIEGEAYLKVAGNAAKPFIVHLPNATAKVMGTEFNVNTYADNQSRIALVDGALTVTSGQHTQLLKPGYAATATGNNLEVGLFNREEEMGWLEGYIPVKNLGEKELIALAARYFGEKLTIDSSTDFRIISSGMETELPLQSFLEKITDPKNIYKAADGYHIKMVGNPVKTQHKD
ncbi:FecR family protein [Chitinophaga sp. S165]|uniref:FecR family protein n=1 Tax=Chitinophaga sp. S165 TaxID=2135462 RepID=UPI000D70C95C|nr:FecR domain-containing protein [Chitinophaga sp. S165]PWV55557.1 FecR family protein [Chitinophaga sp. S165]